MKRFLTAIALLIACSIPPAICTAQQTPFISDLSGAQLTRFGHGFRFYSEKVSVPVAGVMVWLGCLANPATSTVALRMELVNISSNVAFSTYSMRGTGVIYSGGTAANIMNPSGLPLTTSANAVIGATTAITATGGTQHAHSFGVPWGTVVFFPSGLSDIQPGQSICWGAMAESINITGPAAMLIVNYEEYPVGL